MRFFLGLILGFIPGLILAINLSSQRRRPRPGAVAEREEGPRPAEAGQTSPAPPTFSLESLRHQIREAWEEAQQAAEAAEEELWFRFQEAQRGTTKPRHRR